MAAIAAGNYFPEENFSGAAPEAMLIIAKVKPAKNISGVLSFPCRSVELFLAESTL
ncbi:MAG: hypothetical protein ACLUVM_06275 [Blautia faecis]